VSLLSPTIHLPLCSMLIIDGRFFVVTILIWCGKWLGILSDSDVDGIIWLSCAVFVIIIGYSRALPHFRWVSVTDFYVLEFLFLISTMFCYGIVVFVGLIDCYVVRFAFWVVILCCSGCFMYWLLCYWVHFIIDSCWSWGFSFFYWNVCCGYKSNTSWKMLYVVDLSLFQ
jgi:hypothetical protein